MKVKKRNNCQIFFGNNSLDELNSFVLSNPNRKIFVLVDENTLKFCYLKIKKLDCLVDSNLIIIKCGERNKNIFTAIKIWDELTTKGADRNSLLINLGGGVITDIGGFAAATFKRGIDFINVPTTLLAQVDAGIGGKTGIDFVSANNLIYKNQVGIIKFPTAVFAYPFFLSTLSKSEFLSGFAELVKHSLIADKSYWELLKCSFNKSSVYFNKWQLENIIQTSIEIKDQIVERDPLEVGIRKSLNFGHTIGHAVESCSLAHDKSPLTHGRAVAIGMICESFISNKISGLPKKDLEEIVIYLRKWFPKYNLNKKKYPELIELMKNDKKNEKNHISFSLLSKIGKCVVNQTCEESLIIESFNFYFQISSKIK